MAKHTDKISPSHTHRCGFTNHLNRSWSITKLLSEICRKKGLTKRKGYPKERVILQYDFIHSALNTNNFIAFKLFSWCYALVQMHSPLFYGLLELLWSDALTPLFIFHLFQSSRQILTVLSILHRYSVVTAFVFCEQTRQ